MWTHSITNKQITANGLEVSVSFTDGTLKFGRFFIVSSLDQLKQTIQNELDRRNSDDTLLGTITLGAVDLIKKPQSQDEIDRQTWFLNYGKYSAKLAAVQNKLLDPNDPSISDLLTLLKQTYKSEYGVF